MLSEMHDYVYALTNMHRVIGGIETNTPPKYGLCILPMYAEGDYETANARILQTDISKHDSDLWNGMEMLSVWMMYRDSM